MTVFAIGLVIICGLGLVYMLLQFALGVVVTFCQFWAVIQAALADRADRKAQRYQETFR